MNKPSGHWTGQRIGRRGPAGRPALDVRRAAMQERS